jgi:ADP-ribose pyrophosphatase
VPDHRPTVNETLIELPAGTLEPHEDPAVTAARELSEETGYRAGRLELVSEFYLSPGILDEKMRLYVASQLQPGTPHREAAEQIENLIVPISDALAMIADGRLRDAKTILGLWWLQQRR